MKRIMEEINMIKICKEKWAKNEKVLKNALMRDFAYRLDSCDYEYLVKQVVKYILNTEKEEWDIDNIVVINDGDYQGTLLFIIPRLTYQPSEHDYIMTHVNYGSCSGCDTLQAIQDHPLINDYMTLCRGLVCNMINPYNHGWRHEDRFDIVEEGIY